jgi:transposase
LVVERTVEAILHWSTWRRWHQAWARYYHYRRRQNVAAERQTPQVDVPEAEAMPMDVIDVVWRRLEPLLPAEQRSGRPYEYERRLILEAIVYLKQSGCGWRALPSSFPPWQTVYAQLRQWRKTGIWHKIWSGLDKSRSIEQVQL